MSTMNIQGRNVLSKPVIWGGDDPFTHTLCAGPTRCGKTSTFLKRMVYEILKEKKLGKNVGFTLIEPKGDFAQEIYDLVCEMGLQDEMVYIDPERPDITHNINVMRGEKNDVVEATAAVLNSLFGKQEAFFSNVQEASTRKVTMLLKELYEDNMNLLDVLNNLRDENVLKQNVEKARAKFGTTDLITFFDKELLGQGSMAQDYKKLVLGLRTQLENITSNEHLRSIVTGKSDIDLDEHLEKGKILIVNTSLSKLGKRTCDAFGMFVSMHVQLATFRRKGTERTRSPHYLIIDEYSRYINPDVERFLSIAASFRVALIAAIQSFSQLEVESGELSGKAMKRCILNSTRNKIVFSGFEYEDAEEASKIMGIDEIIERDRTFDGGILRNFLPKTYKDTQVEKARFHQSIFMDGLPRFHYVCKLLDNGTPKKPFIGRGEFVPTDWKADMLKDVQEENILLNKKPSIFDWRNRAKYNVALYEQEHATKIQEEKTKLLDEHNPFATFKNDAEQKPTKTLSDLMLKQQQKGVPEENHTTIDVVDSHEETLASSQSQLNENNKEDTDNTINRTDTAELIAVNEQVPSKQTFDFMSPNIQSKEYLNNVSEDLISINNNTQLPTESIEETYEQEQNQNNTLHDFIQETEQLNQNNDVFDFNPFEELKNKEKEQVPASVPKNNTRKSQMFWTGEK